MTRTYLVMCLFVITDSVFLVGLDCVGRITIMLAKGHRFVLDTGRESSEWIVNRVCNLFILGFPGESRNDEQNSGWQYSLIPLLPQPPPLGFQRLPHPSLTQRYSAQ